jgi:hypothetical protein
VRPSLELPVLIVDELLLHLLLNPVPKNHKLRTFWK